MQTQLQQEPESQEQHQKQAQSLAYQFYQAFFNESPNRYRLLDKVKRYGVVEEDELTDKTIYLSERAKKILRVVLKMIFRKGRALINKKYMYTITKCCDKQNKRLLNELLDFIQYKKIPVWEGRKFTYYFCIKLSASLQGEIRDVELQNSNIGWTKMSTLICNNRDSSKEEYRSIGANPSSNSNLNPSNNISLVDAKKEQVTSTNKTEAVVKQLQGKSPRPANIRKKTTKSQHKARIYQLPPQFDKPKTLVEMEPINEKECAMLQSKSGREFTLNAQNEILQDMAKRLTRTFNSRWQFICYFSDCLRYEKRDAVQCSNTGFYIKANKQPDELVAIKTHQEQESLFSEIEDRAITSPCPGNQLKAKWACVLPRNDGYKLLSNLRNLQKNDTVLEVNLANKVELMERTKLMMLSEAQLVGCFMDVQKLEIVV